MKKIFTLIAFILAAGNVFSQAVCDSSANVIIYSNYDGGTLNIDIDQNIPNIKIGIVSYEAVKVNISGTYVGNVTEVRYAGYNGTNNTNCSPTVASTSITGVPNSIDTIISYPVSTYSNPNGYGYIICNYSCDDQTNQGGCNTPDQIVHYFITSFGGSLYYHETQYGCWSPATNYMVSAGGNCCISPFVTSVSEESERTVVSIIPNPADDRIEVNAMLGNSPVDRIEIVNLLGEVVMGIEENITGAITIDTGSLPAGVYFVRASAGNKMAMEKFIIAR
jgi:hypothetical protein